MNISSNLVNIDYDKSVSHEEYVDRLIFFLKDILANRFPTDNVKQQIKVHRDRINISCPYCGDSMQSSYKKRGNIILEGKHRNYYKCFNCGEFKRVDNFFKDYKISLELDVINYISNNLGDFTTSSSGRYDISLLLDVKTIEGYAIDRQELKNNFNLIEAKESPVWSWLSARLQYFHPERFLYSPSEKYVLILNLTPSGKIIGSQKRTFSGDNKYLTLNLAKMYDQMGKGKVPDEINTISQLFGILNINFNQPITVFEGPFDSFMFRNSVANTGANKSFPLSLPVRYWYDDDETGRRKSLEMIENGESVFLWSKFKHDFELPLRKKWDLNDIMIFAKQENKNLPFFENYFSSDPLDIIDL